MEEEILEAGADTQDTSTAEETGNQGEESAGADTQGEQSAETEGGEADETTGQETEEVTEENKDRGAHQKTFDERLKEIEERNERRLQETVAKIEREAQERLAAQQKPFAELTQAQIDQLNNNYTDAVARVADLQESIRLGDRSPETITELRKVEKWIKDTEDWYADNEQKRQNWEQEQRQKTDQQRLTEERTKRLETTANVYRESQNIPQDVWDASAQWFYDQMTADRLLAAKFQDVYRLHGDVAAVEFAYKHALEHMGKKEKQVIQQKEEAKTKLPPGGGAASVKGGVEEEYKKALEHARKHPDSDEAWLALSKAKEARAAARR